MLNQKFKRLFVLLSFVGAAFSFSAIAEVRSMSIERTKVVGGESLNQVSVRCGNDSNPRFMVRPSEQLAQWCSVEVKGLCNKSKYRLATALCKYNSKGFRSLAAKSQTTKSQTAKPQKSTSGTAAVKEQPQQESIEKPKADKAQGLADIIADLHRELILIEEQRIQIEQRRLELVNLEIQLKKGQSLVAGAGD